MINHSFSLTFSRKKYQFSNANNNKKQLKIKFRTNVQKIN